MTKVTSWIDETALLMRERQASIKLKTIAEDCNVSIAWLSKLQTGRLTDASNSKLQRVNAWLKKQVKATT